MDVPHHKVTMSFYILEKKGHGIINVDGLEKAYKTFYKNMKWEEVYPPVYDEIHCDAHVQVPKIKLPLRYRLIKAWNVLLGKED
jgi:hypothetical protein